MENALINLGFSEQEANTYLKLLETNGAYVTELAKRIGANRTSTYHTLDKLIDRGFATKVKKGSYYYFYPSDPTRILEKAKSDLSLASNLIPELLSIHNKIAHKPKIRYFERASGIESIFEDTLSANGELLGYTNIELLIETFPGYFKRYSKERISRKIKVRYLSPKPKENKSLFGLLEESLPGSIDSALLEILFINSQQFPFNNEIAIYDNKVAIMSLVKDEQMGLLIESKTISQTMRAIFDLAWIGATGFVAL